ncbi:mannose-6-phosphate isomerase, class I [Arthrobacter sp. JZ12]|uniref:mannose-6-phosphate isomerase, class I n=1 Tax=Arthrobacter sp. JZ12 TaxID=2654190 RepID=UPI002B46D7D2|nr:mannose-6-phosphate isomerase, class I [Arthrobacter sp. JZ12]WRH25338.1 mannose-6-phosphate isomerase, class I [Arthrobacter sp. JZ12]
MLIPIANEPLNYNWGSLTALSQILGRKPSGLPEAELWLGTHDGSPTRVVDRSDDGDALLSEWLTRHDPATAGKLPFLLKILAAESPLSLQVHPNKEQAQEGFERENREGVPLNSPARNYKDNAAKPEIIVAISNQFHALAGFRSAKETIADLTSFDDRTTTALAPLIRLLAKGLKPAVEWILLADSAEVEEPLAALLDAAHAQEPDSTTRLLASKYAQDRGLLLALLLNRVTLQRGEALFLPAGNIHAYLHGVGVELMGASDNVLRGGLTTKHVDAAELISIVDYKPTNDSKLEPVPLGSGVYAYRPDNVGFQLIRADGSAETRIVLTGPTIAICLSGEARVRTTKASHDIAQGQSLYLSSEEQAVTLNKGAEVFLAMGETL